MFDVVIIGAGIVGLAIARSIGETTNKSVLVIEKEESFGRGISSRNSEVIHSGIYYKPGSLKAKYCTLGRDMVYDFCEKYNIWYNRCGKLVVGGHHQSEELNKLYKNGQENDVPEIQIIDKKEINKNIKSIENVFKIFLKSKNSKIKPIFVNNYAWLSKLNYINFLREIGKHFTINKMLTFDSVKLRLEREQSLSYMEFNYMMLQAYDFYELFKRHKCILQIGGSDQWGNIVNGADLIACSGYVWNNKKLKPVSVIKKFK